MATRNDNRQTENTDNAKSLPSSTRSSTACPIASGCR